jgi:hypothetical protein
MGETIIVVAIVGVALLLAGRSIYRIFTGRDGGCGGHEHLLNRLREGDEEVIDCPSIDCPLRRLFKQILMEAIEVLEESRKAFKSKQLEGLRKRLIRALAENA